MLRSLMVLCALTVAALAAAPAADAARAPTQAPNDAVIDGPSSAIVGLNGMSIARDGTGGLVYVKDVAGVAHVFVSQLANGAFQPPTQVDGGLPAASSQPVIAAGNGGVLQVAFVNAGALYVAGTTGSGAPIGPPQPLYAPAANPSISMSNFGKAYIAFTALDGAGGGDVRTAYYFQGHWSLGTGPLDANVADKAGTGTGRPDVATSGDGIAIVAWGENGHIYTRRVAKTAPSVASEQADVGTLDGWSEVSASDPEVSTGGDDTFAAVAFQEEIASGATRQSRVLFNRLHGSQFDGIAEPDAAATGGPEGADQPQTAVTEYGSGWVVSEHDQTHELFASALGQNETLQPPGRVDSVPNAGTPDAVPGIAGLTSTFLAWQQNPGSTGPTEIRLRFAADGSDLGAEQVISSPSLGATNADLGLAAGGDTAGDAAVAWVQGSGATTQIVATQFYQPPGTFVPAHAFTYADTTQPTLAWSPANELWGSPLYTVTVDGASAGQTNATQFTLPAPVANGRHSYQVTAVNQAGLSSTARSATVLVDTVSPKLTVRLPSEALPKSIVHLSATYSDPAPRGMPKSAASGVATVSLSWGDGSHATIRARSAAHAYRRKRAYTVTVTATDRAGNIRVVKRRVRIVSKLGRHRAKPKKHKARRDAIAARSAR